ncbi:MAG TPA: DUF255 domain-containing protein [Candidatus Acidoferrales bacterium]|nr:DUF255 domain-containing protein [Candidatus Acidoferrales bacterium]
MKRAMRLASGAALVLASCAAMRCFAQDAPKVPSARKASPAQRAQDSSKAPLTWVGWSDGVFEQARRENRFVLLDLEAVWCHWCHVMADTTYRDPEVIRLLRARYITVRVDQDARPDLSNRYEDYGWPATVVFDGKGNEIVKRQGYLPPGDMASMLQAIIDDPTPGPSVVPEEHIEYSSAAISASLRAELEKDYLDGYDTKEGGWGFGHKFLDWDSVELAMIRAKGGDARAARMVRQTLAGEEHLIDPVWGGVYQYSTDGVWSNPHFEKIMSMQAENLRIFSLGYAQFQDPAALQAAKDIHRFLEKFLLSPAGAFYTSQDADVVDGRHSAAYFRLSDAARRKQGVPRVDTHTYARENGWAAAALATFYSATGDAKALDEARRAVAWAEANRALPDGGFRHDAKDAAGPYLGDSVAMVRAYLALYGSTGDRPTLVHAEQTMRFIDRTFRAPSSASGAGYLTSKTSTDHAYAVHAQRDENVEVARCANLLFYFTGNADYEKMAQEAMRYLAAGPIARRLPVASTLLVDYELSRSPLHLTIVGHKDDPAAQALFQAALRYPVAYKRLEWWDTREGRLPNPDVQYPELRQAAAFICTSRTCSPPIFQAELLRARIDKLTAISAANSGQ